MRSLDWFALIKCEARVAKELPHLEEYIQFWWLFNDYIYYYYQMGKHIQGVIADIYFLKGWKWFAYDFKDAILFRWALLGCLSAKKVADDLNRDYLKRDLLEIY